MSKSVTAREEAVQLLTDAKALAGEDGTVSAENLPRFQELMAQFEAKDKDVAALEQAEGLTSRLAERWSAYTGKMTGEPMRFNSTVIDPNSRLTPGQQFVKSEEFKKLQASGVISSPEAHFRTMPVTIADRIPYGAAATDVINTDTTTGGLGGLVPPYRPGIILQLPQRPRVMRDLFPNVNMPTGDTIQYAAQIGFDNAAAAVAQASTVNTNTLAGGLKPQSSVQWEERDAKASWIATWMVATRQVLSDENQMASLIDNQGRLMIGLAEDNALLNGNGTAPNIKGILNQTGLQLLNLGGSDNLDGVRTARTLTMTGIARMPATFIVVNPTDSEEFDILKTTTGEYRGGNPIGNFNFDNSIWRLQRAESEAIAVGHALVGARSGATIWDRDPLRVLTADQHSDFFVRNLIVVLFEERLAFPVYFPSAFVDVTLAAWT